MKLSDLRSEIAGAKVGNILIQFDGIPYNIRELRVDVGTRYEPGTVYLVAGPLDEVDESGVVEDDFV